MDEIRGDELGQERWHHVGEEYHALGNGRADQVLRRGENYYVEDVVY